MRRFIRVARRSRWLCGLLVCPAAMPLAAQHAPRTAVQQAREWAQQGDTARAVALLDSTVRVTKRDGAAWHLLGLLRWEQARSRRNPNHMKDQGAIRLLIGADTALRLATQFAPDSARFWMSLSRFNLQSGVSTMRFAAQGEVARAIDAATTAADAPLLAAALDEQGMFAWRRYETVAHRGFTTDGQRIQIDQVTNWPRDRALDFVKSFVSKIEPPTGTADYTEALERFHRAVAQDSTSLRASRHLYMALAERARWEELWAIAERRSAQFPLDYQARLARGLALHRLGRDVASRAAFDSALTLMDDEERDRLTRFTRILRPQAVAETKASGGDSAAYSRLPEAQRRGLEAMYWLMNDPLTLTEENEYRLEFLSRIVFADFRWTDEDQNLRGADTDRGDIYVRYGPPDFQVTTAGGTTQTGGVTLVWSYRAGFTFFFDLVPGFGTSRLARNDRDNVERLRNAVPVSWSNLASTVVIDTIAIRVTRFRASGDSTDAVVATAVPMEPLLRDLAGERFPVDLDIRTFDQFVRIRDVESSQVGISADAREAPLARTWVRRVGPGINVVRVEAFQSESRRAARAMARLEPVATTGFGMSDVLLGTPSPAGETAVPAPAQATRWRDVGTIPTIGDVPRGGRLGLVWELYELGAEAGMSSYRVAVSVARTDRGGPVGAAVRLLDGAGRALGRGQQRRDAFTISFTRQAPASPRVVDALSLDLAEVPTGDYRLTVDITDARTGRRTTRTTAFRVR